MSEREATTDGPDVSLSSDIHLVPGCVNGHAFSLDKLLNLRESIFW